MNPRRKEKAETWATSCAGDRARHDVWWDQHAPAPLTFAELRKVAHDSSVMYASNYTRAFAVLMDDLDLTDWEQVFVKAFVGAYAVTVVAELEQREKREKEHTHAETSDQP